MSASLVGSEMCIRDRYLCLCVHVEVPVLVLVLVPACASVCLGSLQELCTDHVSSSQPLILCLPSPFAMSAAISFPIHMSCLFFHGPHVTYRYHAQPKCHAPDSCLVMSQFRSLKLFKERIVSDLSARGLWDPQAK
eukprot:5339441-Alexandrium_andersonii.AAC.1